MQEDAETVINQAQISLHLVKKLVDSWIPNPPNQSPKTTTQNKPTFDSLYSKNQKSNLNNQKISKLHKQIIPKSSASSTKIEPVDERKQFFINQQREINLKKSLQQQEADEDQDGKTSIGNKKRKMNVTHDALSEWKDKKKRKKKK